MRKLFFLGMLLGIIAMSETAIAFDIRGYCRQVSDVVGGSYQIMEACVQIELESKSRIDD